MENKQKGMDADFVVKRYYHIRVNKERSPIRVLKKHVSSPKKAAVVKSKPTRTLKIENMTIKEIEDYVKSL